MGSKKELRLYYRELQAGFPREQFVSWNQLLAPKLREVLERRVIKNSYIAVYHARAQEASLSSLLDLPYRFCFPKVLNRNGQMEFRWVQEPQNPESFSCGPWGIQEPKVHCPVIEKKDMQAGFIPLLAFDGEGGRLGQGKGFYDRFLENFPGLKLGVAFEWQFSSSPLPMEGHDHFLDIVVSECAVRDF